MTNIAPSLFQRSLLGALMGEHSELEVSKKCPLYLTSSWSLRVPQKALSFALSKNTHGLQGQLLHDSCFTIWLSGCVTGRLKCHDACHHAACSSHWCPTSAFSCNLPWVIQKTGENKEIGRLMLAFFHGNVS